MSSSLPMVARIEVKLGSYMYVNYIMIMTTTDNYMFVKKLILQSSNLIMVARMEMKLETYGDETLYVWRRNSIRATIGSEEKRLFVVIYKHVLLYVSCW